MMMLATVPKSVMFKLNKSTFVTEVRSIFVFAYFLELHVGSGRGSVLNIIIKIAISPGALLGP